MFALICDIVTLIAGREMDASVAFVPIVVGAICSSCMAHFVICLRLREVGAVSIAKSLHSDFGRCM